MIPNVDKFYAAIYLLPTVLQVIAAVEHLAADRPGTEKRAMALAGVQTMTDALHQFGIVDKEQQSGLDQLAIGMIDATVHAQNTLGLFEHKKSEEQKKQETAGPEMVPGYDQRSADEQDRARRRAIPIVPRPTPANEVIKQAEADRQDKLIAAGWPGKGPQSEEERKPERTA